MAFESKTHLVEAVMPDGYSIARTKHNTRKYIITKADGSEAYIAYNGSFEKMAEDIKADGFDEFLKKNYTASVAPRNASPKEPKVKQQKAAASKVRAAKGERKALKEELKVERETAKARKARIEEKESQIADVTVKIMNMSLVRGSKQHLALREQLHRLDAELKAIDGYEDFYSRQTELSSEDLRSMRELGEHKRKERKAKLDKIKRQKNKG